MGPIAADEEHGEVWFGALAWSGSWRITVEHTQLDAVRVTGGFNPFDFGYKLKPGEHLETPIFYGGYSDHGLGGASRLMHHFEIAHILPQAPDPKPRPVIYNSWEATEFRVDEAGQIAIAEKAASIGVDRFVMDDGWFGQRKDDHAGLGDWYVNPEKFPHGLKPLIDKVHSLGMDFGLWVEPEMVNPDSDLYRKHPDWVLNFPGRPRSESRNQLVLNLARPDVRDYVEGFLDKLLTENDIAFLKWDYNRNWSEPGWDQVPVDEQKRVYIEFIRNLYAILADLRKKHPKVEIESCSGGGGRVDLGILRYTDEVWPSDNTDPFDRLSMQDGFTYAYTPQIMMAWVTDSPHWLNNKRTTSLAYRMLSSMQGSLGIGANLNQLDRRGFCHRQASDRRVSLRAANDRPRRSLSPDQPARWQRIFRHRNGLQRQKSGSRVCLRQCHARRPRFSAAATPRSRSRRRIQARLDRRQGPARHSGERLRRLVDAPRSAARIARRFPGCRIPAGSPALIP